MKKGTKAWLDFAHRDLESSRLLVDSEYVSNVVLFHAQQCVEKCLKALGLKIKGLFCNCLG